MTKCHFSCTAMLGMRRLFKNPIKSSISLGVKWGHCTFSFFMVSSIAGPCRNKDAAIVIGEYCSVAAVKSGAPVSFRRRS